MTDYLLKSHVLEAQLLGRVYLVYHQEWRDLSANPLELNDAEKRHFNLLDAKMNDLEEQFKLLLPSVQFTYSRTKLGRNARRGVDVARS